MLLGASLADYGQRWALSRSTVPSPSGIRFLLLSRETEDGLTLGAKAIWAAFCRRATQIWITFLYSKANRWQGCVAISYVLSFPRQIFSLKLQFPLIINKFDQQRFLFFGF